MNLLTHLNLLMLWVLLLVGAAGCTAPATSAEPTATSEPVSVYFTTAVEDPLAGAFAQTGALVLHSPEAVTGAFATNPELTALYIGEGSLGLLEPDWLHQLYAEEILIGAVNEPISALQEATGAAGEMPDIDFASTPEGFFVFSSVLLVEDSLSGYGYQIVSDYFPTVAGAVEAVNAGRSNGQGG